MLGTTREGGEAAALGQPRGEASGVGAKGGEKNGWIGKKNMKGYKWHFEGNFNEIQWQRDISFCKNQKKHITPGLWLLSLK